jgi:hypothetical protein
MSDKEADSRSTMEVVDEMGMWDVGGWGRCVQRGRWKRVMNSVRAALGVCEFGEEEEGGDGHFLVCVAGLGVGLDLFRERTQ